jgi:transcriptional regulator with XRE-family HTH domain
MAKGLTQNQLAQRLGIKQAHIARYEQRGYSGYTVETLNGIVSVHDPDGKKRPVRAEIGCSEG